MRSAGFSARVREMFQPCFRGGNDGAEEGEGPRAGHCSESAGDPRFDLPHPQIPFGLIVSEGDGEVIKESQHVGFELVQPDQEIVSGRWARVRGFRSV